MELKHLITHFVYRIEPKPEGGFIARATDPSVPPLEASTREELQQKIQARIAAGLAEEFPGLKLPLNTGELKFAFHVERKPGGGFAIHSADPNAQVIEGHTDEEMESHFATKLLGFVGKHFMPELPQALAAGGGSGDTKVVVNNKNGIVINAGSHRVAFGDTKGLPAAGQSNDFVAKGLRMQDAKTISDVGTLRGVGDNSPIMPESSGLWKVLAILALLIIAILVYFLLHRG